MMTTIKEMAASLVERYATNDPKQLCQYLNIEVLNVELPMNVKGFYSYLFGMQFIYLNCALTLEEQRLVCAHELGHALLHSRQNSLFLLKNTDFVSNRFEREADIFSGYLLLDKDTIRESRYYNWTVQQLAAYTGLSDKIVEYCCKN